MAKVEQHYIILWVIVIVLCVLNIICFGVLLLGQGRWVCEEYNNICTRCVENGTLITNDRNMSVILNWQVNGNNFSNSDLCFCTRYEQKCVREVWTRKLGD